MTVQETSFAESLPLVCPDLACVMQRTLVPPISFESARLEVHGRTIPRDRLGGDLSDLVASDADTVAYVADVSGHDVCAGVLMGMVKTAARYGLMLGQSFPELLDGINRVLPSVKDPSMYATFAGLRLGGANEMEYAIAGNMPLLHYRYCSKDVVRLSMEQFPLGLFPGVRYSSRRVDCSAGDLFAMFTDGLVESQDLWEEDFGLERLEKVLCRCADQGLENIYDAALGAVRGSRRAVDDQTLMLVRVLESGGHSHAD